VDGRCVDDGVGEWVGSGKELVGHCTARRVIVGAPARLLPAGFHFNFSVFFFALHWRGLVGGDSGVNAGSGRVNYP
jgi:hypothetical protein